MKSIPSVQKFNSRKEWEAYVWGRIIEGLAGATSSGEIDKSLNLLITAYEKKHMVKRAAAISFLKQGKSYREIEKTLWLAPSTISAIKKSMRGGEGYITHHARRNMKKTKQKSLSKKEQNRLEFKLLVEAMFSLPPPPPPSRRRPGGEKRILPHGKLVFAQRRR